MSWFNPGNGKTGKKIVLKKKDVMDFIPPSTGEENDWVLIIEKK